ncbi:uncharacterized protein LOC110449496 isoform X1 [Mizuhopecten yessoensis]|uniref:uncharacterized protein LOC110449496 isoform X1 n=1 Tax=Mizuhopecten yessoensis TaxID=6573 RepID=UPI000B45E0CC|nr:uncharacterized protein LOC110449496 isoform X1 [Mizuhopecten yessoensis]
MRSSTGYTEWRRVNRNLKIELCSIHWISLSTFVTTMAAQQKFSKTSYSAILKIDPALKEYIGEGIQALLQSHSVSDDTVQKAYEEYVKLLNNFKEFSDKHPKERASMLNVQLRGQIALSDKAIEEYEQRARSPLVKLMKTKQQHTDFNKAVLELHGLVSATHKLEQIKSGDTKKTERPAFGRSRSRDDGVEQPSRPPLPVTDMDTADKGEGKKKPLPLPENLSSSMMQGRQIASMPMIEFQQMVRRMESQQRDIDEMTSRLSRFASNQVTQGNPNIADLSDKNRPTKIGEKFGGLYDDEWSEAFEAFKTLLRLENEEDEPEIISQLLRVVNLAQMFCADVAGEQLEQLKLNLKRPILEVAVPSAGGKQRVAQKCEENKGLQSTCEKYARNFRKECALQCVPAVIQLFKTTQVKTSFEWAKSNYPEQIHKYVERCVELVWLMSVQDPPMFLASADAGDKVRTDLFTYYGRKGRTVSATVWPAVLLHSDGPIISKGYIIPQ